VWRQPSGGVWNVIMGRLIPAGAGMDYYRQVKIAGEDIVEEEPPAEAELEPMMGDDLHAYRDQTPSLYTGGLSEEIVVVEEPLAE
jgi:DNA-directed RNA polymerase subunit beta'